MGDTDDADGAVDGSAPDGRAPSEVGAPSVMSLPMGPDMAMNGPAPYDGAGSVPPGPLAVPPAAPWPESQPEPAPPATAPPHRWGLGAYLLVELVFLGVSALVAALLAPRLSSDAGAIALALSVPTVCAAALAMLITVVRGNGPVVDLRLRVTARDVGVGLTCGVLGLFVTVPASVLYVAVAGKDATSAIGEVFGNVHAGPVMAVTVLVIVVFVAPLCEEIVYRGLLWGAVERLGARRWWAMAITTVVFALAHFELARTPLLLVVALPIGVARVLTGRLPAGVIAHGINNLLPGIGLALGLLGVVPLS